MPPKSRISRQMILSASIEVVRTKGLQNLNVRAVATELNCSTQPIMYHFATMDELKTEIFDIIAEKHFAELLSLDIFEAEDPCLELSRKYIRFSVAEPNLFRFLYQSDRFSADRLDASWEQPQLVAFLAALAQKYDLSPGVAKNAFICLLLSAHGFASFLANNTISYNGAQMETYLNTVQKGCIATLKEG
ncbi:MAG: TetR/AcrR family transcriptional regulator [Oscillospiraceae bacterium]|nr:TetR/AcrR family transcriptional regulator [Oscillospiraceae bacterium]